MSDKSDSGYEADMLEAWEVRDIIDEDEPYQTQRDLQLELEATDVE